MPRRTSFPSFARRLTALLCLLLAAATAHAADWQWLEPSPQGNTLRDIAHGNGRYVAVGDAGTLLASTDGTQWQRLPAASRATLHAVAFGDGVFVAVGEGGAVVRSSDGEHWEAVGAGIDATLYHVAHGGAGFVAAGGLALVVSADGSDWATVDHGIVPESSFPPSFQGVAWGNGRYVAMVDLGPVTPDVAKTLISGDGIAWTLHDFPPPASGEWGGGPVFFRGLAYGGGHFVAAGIRVGGSNRGLTFRSADGVTWEWFRLPQHTGSRLYLKSLDYDAANGRFVGLANPNDPPPNPDVFASVVESADGTAWTLQTDITGLPLQPVRFAHDRLFAFTQNGEIHGSGDGASWTRLTAPTRAWTLRALTANALGVVAVGDRLAAQPLPRQTTEGVVLHSGDGLAFDALDMPTMSGYVVRQAQGAAASASTFVVAALETSGSVLNPPIKRNNALYVRRGGAPWQRFDTAALGGVEDLVHVAHGDGLFLVTARDEYSASMVLRSTDDGVHWESLPVSGTSIVPGKVVHGDGGFIALPYDFGTTVAISADGQAWSDIEIWRGSGGQLQDIAYHDGTYLVAGETVANMVRTSWLLRSTDGGATWQATKFASHSIRGLAGTPSGFVLTANGGDVLVSGDGLAWEASWSGAQNPGVATGDAGGRLWIATSTGGILGREGGGDGADLQLGIDGPETFARGATVAYGVLVDNAGPATATQAVVTLAADVPATGVATTAAKGWSCAVQPAKLYRATCVPDGAGFGAGTHALFSFTVATAGKLFPPRFAVRAQAVSAVEDPVPGDNADALTVQMTRTP